MAGVAHNDRQKGAHARKLILDEIIKIFEMESHKMSEGEKELKKELLLRMCANTLPRLHEVTGEGGGALKISFDPVFNAITRPPEESNPEPSAVQSDPSGTP